MKEKPLYYFSDAVGLSRSFARTLRIEYGFGIKLGTAWYCTAKEWADALAKRKARTKNVRAGKPQRGKNEPV